MWKPTAQSSAELQKQNCLPLPFHLRAKPTNQGNHRQPEVSKVSFCLFGCIFVFSLAWVPKLNLNLSPRVHTLLRRHSRPASTCHCCHRGGGGGQTRGGRCNWGFHFRPARPLPAHDAGQPRTQVPARERGG